MPTKGKTAMAQNMQKWKRLKKIKGALKVSSYSIAELEKIVFGNQNDRNNRRTMQNYLQELVQIEDIYLDQKTGNYVSRESRQTYASKADYDLAITHSHDIFFYKYGKRGFEVDMPYFCDEETTLLQLIFLEEDKKRMRQEDEEGDNENRAIINEDSNNSSNWYPKSMHTCELGEHSDYQYSFVYLLQHIKTGYPEIFILMKELKQFLASRGVTSGYIIHKSAGLIENIPGIPPLKLNDEEKHAFEDIVDSLVAKLRRLTRDVVDKIPLLGYCDGCPTSRITIRDKPEK